MTQTAELAYQADAADVIVAVDPNWDEFAQANASPQVVAAQVLGHPLWEFIVGTTSRALYAQMLSTVRGGKDVRFALRCDGPAYRRRLEMTITALADGNVEFRTRELSVEPRAYQALFDPQRPHDNRMLRACSWCNRVEVGGRWVEVEDAVQELDLFERAQLPTLTHGICQDCYERLTEPTPTLH